VHTFLSGNLKERVHMEGAGAYGILRKRGGKVWTGFIWLRIWSSGGLL
jgi:hypothetical protein